MTPTLSASREEATFAVDSSGRGSKVDRIYSALKQTIVSGALAPDSPIDKGEWSARFEVSRLSVTTAINRLAYERLVVIEPQRGTEVPKRYDGRSVRPSNQTVAGSSAFMGASAARRSALIRA